MKELLVYLEERTSNMLNDVEKLVRIESPSHNREAIDRVQDVNQDWFGSVGQVARFESAVGDLLHVHVPGRGTGRVLLLAHVDTVHPIGSWQDTWRIQDEKAFGPGVYDMKAGVVQALWALRSVQALHERPAPSVDLLLTVDEEIGSETARPLIEDLARGAAAVLVLEAPYMNGDLKIARKGVGVYTISVHGKAAHQGLEPESGRNAIVSAAHLIQEIIRLQDPHQGTTLGPNVIQGGTVANVVADTAMLNVDLRVWTLSEAARVDASIRAIPALKGTSYEVSGGLDRPPMEPSDGSMQLFEKARCLAGELGFQIGATRVGGASDGNLTSQLAPTLDGFGAMGAHAHQKDLEYIHIPSLAPRTALLAGMLLGD
jgi:glutamate carboxypeptidase